MLALRAVPLLAATLAACRTVDAPVGDGTGGPAPPAASRPATGTDHLIFDSETGAPVTLEEVADALSDYDVVFLGELHDNDVGHRLQAELATALHRRRGNVVLSFEMFERDVQAELDRYLAGAIDEEEFLAGSRPWSNYAEHYRPGIELARREGLPVIAANVPRPLAARVVREGVKPVLRAPFAPRFVHARPEGEYYRRFVGVMSGHGGVEGVEVGNVYAAQCIKDDAMAESIADALGNARGETPLVIHWCGRFHSDYGLGTVERLKLRRAGLRCAVITMQPRVDLDAPLGDDERAAGRFVMRVPVQEQALRPGGAEDC